MGLIVIFVAIAIGGLLFWQNLQVITLVFFGGIVTITLPIAAWVLLFVVLGMISHLTLQFLYSFGRSLPLPKTSPRMPSKPSPPRQTFVEDRPRTEVQSPISPVYQGKNDWERGEGMDDWNLEAPPEEPTSIRNSEVFEKTVAREDTTSFETKQDPKASSKTGSVYSYSYREAKQTSGETADSPANPAQVYDVNYRIITPPPQSAKDERESKGDDEEDWI